jgi:ribosome recycling factor
MIYDFSNFKKRAGEAVEHLSKELSAIQTGRASMALMDGVTINSYGARLAVSHVATIATEDARTIRIVPWDKANSKEIEKAINAANLGVSVSTDDGGLRVFFPELTTERRVAFTKITRDKIEEARIVIKGDREKTKNAIVAAEHAGEINEDEKTKVLEDLQKLVDEANKNLVLLGDKKERDLLGK